MLFVIGAVGGCLLMVFLFRRFVWRRTTFADYRARRVRHEEEVMEGIRQERLAMPSEEALLPVAAGLREIMTECRAECQAEDGSEGGCPNGKDGKGARLEQGDGLLRLHLPQRADQDVSCLEIRWRQTTANDGSAHARWEVLGSPEGSLFFADLAPLMNYLDSRLRSAARSPEDSAAARAGALPEGIGPSDSVPDMAELMREMEDSLKS